MSDLDGQARLQPRYRVHESSADPSYQLSSHACEQPGQAEESGCCILLSKSRCMFDTPEATLRSVNAIQA